jgi:hypothetical protein
MKALSKDEMKKVMGGGRVACMECGGSLGTVCLLAPEGGVCSYEEEYGGIYCGTENGQSMHYCSDY